MRAEHESALQLERHKLDLQKEHDLHALAMKEKHEELTLRLVDALRDRGAVEVVIGNISAKFQGQKEPTDVGETLAELREESQEQILVRAKALEEQRLYGST